MILLEVHSSLTVLSLYKVKGMPLVKMLNYLPNIFGGDKEIFVDLHYGG